MGMSTEKTRKAFQDCLDIIRNRRHWWSFRGDGKRLDPTQHAVLNAVGQQQEEGMAHLIFMCEEGARLIDTVDQLYIDAENNAQDSDDIYERAISKKQKAMRWLGFIQGALWSSGFVTVEEMKHINMPDAEKTDASPASSR